MGGAERVTASLANFWASEGHDVVLATLANDPDYYYVDSRVRRISLHAASSSTSFASGLWANASRLATVRRLLKKERPDVAVGMMTTASNLIGLAALGLGVPAIGAERLFPPKNLPGRGGARLQRASYGHLKSVIAQTEKGAEWLRKHTRAPRVAVIGNPIELPLPRHAPFISPESFHPELGDRKIVLCAGRLVRQKRFDQAIRAFASLATDFPDWRLVLAGDGPDREDLEREVVDLGVERRVLFIGRAGNLSDWYARASLYLMTSDFEGFPNTLLEAMASGLACIAVDCDTGPRDLIVHDESGILVSLDDEDGLRGSLARCMADDGLRAALGGKASCVIERFGMRKIIDAWEREFQLARTG